MNLTWSGSDELAERAGKCYTLAMEFVVLNLARFGAQRLFLVHGLLHPDRAEGMNGWEVEHPGVPRPPVNPHAWVELELDDGVACLDPVVRHACERSEFDLLWGAERLRRYRADVALVTAGRNESCGPWDRRSLAEWQRRQDAAAADPRYSQDAALARYGLVPGAPS